MIRVHWIVVPGIAGLFVANAIAQTSPPSFRPSANPQAGATGVPGQGVPGQGVPGQGVPGQGVPGQGVPGQGVPGQGGAGAAVPGFSPPGIGGQGSNGFPGQGPLGQGSFGQGPSGPGFRGPPGFGAAGGNGTGIAGPGGFAAPGATPTGPAGGGFGRGPGGREFDGPGFTSPSAGSFGRGPGFSNPSGTTPPDFGAPKTNFGDHSPLLPVQDEYSCSKCNRTVSASATSCPYCNVSFDYTEEADGSRRYSGRGIAGLVKLGIGAVILVVGGIAALFRKLAA